MLVGLQSIRMFKDLKAIAERVFGLMRNFLAAGHYLIAGQRLAQQ